VVVFTISRPGHTALVFAPRHAAATTTYYALTSLGFAAPFLPTLAAPLAGYPALLALSAALAFATAGLVTRQSRYLEPYEEPGNLSRQACTRRSTQRLRSSRVPTCSKTRPPA
jgi:hypothetical protein